MRTQTGREEDDTTVRLPLRLDTLKAMIRSGLPMLSIKRKQILVSSFGQPFLLALQKDKARVAVNQAAWIYWYDPTGLCRAILSATNLPMRFGPGEFYGE